MWSQKMSLTKTTFVHISVLLIVQLISTSNVACEEYKANVVIDFVASADKSLNTTGVCSMGLQQRREKCKFAINSSALKEFNGKVVFGSLAKPDVFEFEYVNPVNGNTKVKKWAIKCATKPLIFVANGDEENSYEVFVKKDA